MKYAHYIKEKGTIVGFYDDKIHKTIPEPNVAISDEEWQDCLKNPSLCYINDDTYNKNDCHTLKFMKESPSPFHIRNGSRWVFNKEAKENAMNAIRAQRNKLIADSDWAVLPDSPFSDEEKEAWKEYRQVLRDFPKKCDLKNPVWPTPPGK